MTKLLALILPLLLLAACAPAPAPAEAPPPTVAAPLPVDETPLPAEPVAALPADYLVGHMDGDENSHELFHYAFWTDDTRGARCDVWIGGQNDPYVDCFVMYDSEDRVTYAQPADTARDCSIGADGFQVGLTAIPADAGYDLPRALILGCWDTRVYPSPEVAAATLVLPDGAALDIAPFHCAMDAAVATCDYAEIGASISLGLSEIAVVN